MARKATAAPSYPSPIKFEGDDIYENGGGRLCRPKH